MKSLQYQVFQVYNWSVTINTCWAVCQSDIGFQRKLGCWQVIFKKTLMAYWRQLLLHFNHSRFKPSTNIKDSVWGRSQTDIHRLEERWSWFTGAIFLPNGNLLSLFYIGGDHLPLVLLKCSSDSEGDAQRRKYRPVSSPNTYRIIHASCFISKWVGLRYSVVSSGFVFGFVFFLAHLFKQFSSDCAVFSVSRWSSASAPSHLALSHCLLKRKCLQHF